MGNVRYPEITVTITGEDSQGILFPDIRVAQVLRERNIPPKEIAEFRRECGGGVSLEDWDEARRNRAAWNRVRARTFTRYKDRVRICQSWVTLVSDVPFLNRFILSEVEGGD